MSESANTVDEVDLKRQLNDLQSQWMTLHNMAYTPWNLRDIYVTDSATYSGISIDFNECEVSVDPNYVQTFGGDVRFHTPSELNDIRNAIHRILEREQ